MRRLIPFMFLLTTPGCSSGRIERDERPSFTIDPTQDFRLEFGRGSGLQGLDTVKIDRMGSVVLHRLKRDYENEKDIYTWQTATLHLTHEAMVDVVKAVEENGLTKLHRAYHENIHDGTQWVFWLKQGEHEKTIYFNNRFPKQITQFAKQLDGILAAAGRDRLAWQAVPEDESRKHERELWDSIKR